MIFGKKICQWCVQHEAAQRGELADDAPQPVMAAPWVRRESSVTLTQIILGANAMIFIAMVLASGPSLDFTGQVMVHFGANFGPFTLSGQWWRLLTYMFLHGGLMHIAFNMWCLWDLGSVLERLMGWKSFVITYIVTGIAGSELSLAWVFCCSTKAIRLPRFQCWRVPSSSTPIHCSSGTTSRSGFSELDIASAGCVDLSRRHVCGRYMRDSHLLVRRNVVAVSTGHPAGARHDGL